MRILWLAPEWPFPMRTGGRLRVGKMLQAVARTDEVDLLAGLALPDVGASSYEVPDWLGELRRWKAVATDPRPRWHRFVAALGSSPYLCSWYHVRELGDLARQWAMTRKYEVVVA